MFYVALCAAQFDISPRLAYQLLAPMSPEDETRLWDYSVQGIVNLLENNTHAGLAEALSFCYHEEPDIRSIFITIFGKALERSVKLSSAKQENVGERHSYICEVRCSCVKADRSTKALKAPDVRQIDLRGAVVSFRFPAAASLIGH